MTQMYLSPVYWLYWADLELLCKEQMEQWDGTVLNATCADLGPKFLQLFLCPQQMCYNLISIWQRENSALNTLPAHDLPGLADVLVEVGTTH